ncbi:hypothetical protein MRB53_018201 [Persea americana]|uniref:Uncharacterized protein n=1 Tax=Persea americana TaxID=3435 RepID=A0ACC2M8N0_PERAE|nr:hypothetical protein MRB53_018201 [Persea americana]
MEQRGALSVSVLQNQKVKKREVMLGLNHKVCLEKKKTRLKQLPSPEKEGKDQKIRTPTSLESAAGAMLSGRGWLQQLVSTSADTTKKLDEEITSVTDDEDGQIPAHHSSGRNDSKQTKTQGV